MRFSEIVGKFDSMADFARAIGSKRHAVYRWPERYRGDLPDRVLCRILGGLIRHRGVFWTIRKFPQLFNSGEDFRLFNAAPVVWQRAQVVPPHPELRRTGVFVYVPRRNAVVYCFPKLDGKLEAADGAVLSDTWEDVALYTYAADIGEFLLSDSQE